MDFLEAPHTQVLAVAAVLVTGVTVYNTLSTSTAKVPGPWYTKWTGLVKHYHTLHANKPKWVHSLHQQYGPVVRVSPNEVSISDPKDLKVVYNVKESFIKSQFYEAFAGPHLNEPSVFSTRDRESHRNQRRLLAGAMSESNLKLLYDDIFTLAGTAIARMSEELATRGVIDIAKWWLFYTTDTIGTLTFGSSFEMLELGKKTQYSEDLAAVGKLTGIQIISPSLFRYATYIPGIAQIFGDAQNALLRLEGYATTSIKRQETAEKETLFSKIIRAKDEDKMSYSQLRANARSYIVAGSDTTSTTLTYLVWSVCGDLKMRDRLVEEVKGLSDEFTDADTRQLKFLNCVIKETLRLYGAVPAGMPRDVPAGGAVIGGYHLDAGVTVAAQPYTVNRNPEVFPNPDEFNPDRWLHETREMNDSIFTFGGGSRICIGLHLAEMEIRVAASKFFREFPNVSRSSKEGMTPGDMDPKLMFLMFPAGGRCLVQN